MSQTHDSAALVAQPARTPWWFIFIQMSPLILQLVGELVSRTPLLPVTVSVGDKSVPLLVVAETGPPSVRTSE